MIGLILQRIASAISNRSGSVQLSSDEAVASFVVSVVLARRIAVRATDQSAGRMSCIALYNITELNFHLQLIIYRITIL